MKLIKRILGNTYVQWSILIIIFGTLLVLGIGAIVVEDNMIKGK